MFSNYKRKLINNPLSLFAQPGCGMSNLEFVMKWHTVPIGSHLAI